MGISRDISRRKGTEAGLRNYHHRLEKQVREQTVELSNTIDQLKREITERQRAEEALRESEEKYCGLVERANDGVAIIQDTIVKYANPRVAEMWGGTIEEIIGTPFTDYVHPDELAVVSERYRRRMAGEDVTPIYETIFRRKDGSKIYIEVNAGVIPYQGKPADLVFVRDITEHKRAKEALQVAVQQWQATFNAINDAVCLLDNEGRIQQCNKAMMDLLGKPFREITGRVCCELVHGTPEPLEGCPYVRMRETHCRETMVLPWGDGWVEVATDPLLDEDGRLKGAVHIMTNTTERRRAEEALRRSLEDTAHSHRLLLALSQAAQAVQRARTTEEIYHVVGEEVTKLGYHAAVFTLTKDQAHLTISHLTFEPGLVQAVERLTGLSGQDYRFLRPGSFFQQAIAERKTIFTDRTAEYIADTLPGPIHHLADQIATLLGVEHSIVAPLIVGGVAFGLLAVTGTGLSETDVAAVTAFASQAAIALENARLLNAVTERERELRNLSAQLISAQEAERRRISRELHDEMGQSLTAMQINLATMEEELPLECPPIIRERLEETIWLTERTLKQMRELSFDLRPSMLDDLGLVPTVRWYVHGYTKRLNVEVEFEAINFEERLPMEVETVLYRAVQEALTNVARHAQANRVWIRLERKESTVTAFIEDDGRGFDIQEMAGREALKRGMGLIGMRERVASLGGSLNIRSRPGQGTRLTIEIPFGTAQTASPSLKPDP